MAIMGLHILWINEIANFTGGCERYIADTDASKGQVNVLSRYD